jgi:hypothetical protein
MTERSEEHDPVTEQPEEKDLQDHTFGLQAAEDQEKAEESGEGPEGERREPHAGGRA